MKEQTKEQSPNNYLFPKAPPVRDILAPSLTFFTEYGIVTDQHLQNVIIELLVRLKHINNVECDYNPRSKSLLCICYVGRWTLLSTKRQKKIVEGSKSIFPKYLPDQNIKIEFRYGKKPL